MSVCRDIHNNKHQCCSKDLETLPTAGPPPSTHILEGLLAQPCSQELVDPSQLFHDVGLHILVEEEEQVRVVPLPPRLLHVGPVGAIKS